VIGLHLKVMLFASFLILVGLALFFYSASTTGTVIHGFAVPSAVASLVSVSGGDAALLSGVGESKIVTFEIRNNGNLVDMNDNVREQWMRFTIIDAVDGTVLSDHYRVFQMIENKFVGGQYHDICTILLSQPASYNPYSDVLIELVVGVNHSKCNVVIVNKGDNAMIVKFDDRVVATTEQITHKRAYTLLNNKILKYTLNGLALTSPNNRVQHFY
jgi:hypothetical protein